MQAAATMQGRLCRCLRQELRTPCILSEQAAQGSMLYEKIIMKPLEPIGHFLLSMRWKTGEVFLLSMRKNIVSSMKY